MKIVNLKFVYWNPWGISISLLSLKGNIKYSIKKYY